MPAGADARPDQEVPIGDFADLWSRAARLGVAWNGVLRILV
jgi:hypothetical protein